MFPVFGTNQPGRPGFKHRTAKGGDGVMGQGVGPGGLFVGGEVCVCVGGGGDPSYTLCTQRWTYSFF